MAAISLSWLIVVKLYKFTGFGHYSSTQYLRAWPIIIIFTFFNVIFRLYHSNILYPSMPLSPVEEFKRLTGSVVITHILVMTILGFMHKSSVISRAVICFSCLLSTIFAPSFRNAMRRLLAKCGIGQIEAVLIGTNQAARRLAGYMNANDYCGFRLRGFFGGKDESVDSLPRLGGIRDAVSVSRTLDIRIAFVCEDIRLFREQLFSLTSYFQYLEFIPTDRLFPISGARPILIDCIGGMEMACQMRMRIFSRWKAVWDRILAIPIALVSLPLFFVVPILIKLTSKGPVFFRHERIGKQGRPIKVWKFRTMHCDADRILENALAGDSSAKEEWLRNRKLAKDPRVTGLGRFLRRTSLDELPQLINVFAGDMTFVGPRPIVPEEVARYGEMYDTFSSVKPGITGLWQVSGRSETDYHRRVALDTYYILNWSPWLDLWIVMRTCATVLSMKGAW